jgi:hypothetical protein
VCIELIAYLVNMTPHNFVIVDTLFVNSLFMSAKVLTVRMGFNLMT